MTRSSGGNDRSFSTQQQQQIALGIAAVTSLSVALLLWYKSSSSSSSSSNNDVLKSPLSIDTNEDKGKKLKSKVNASSSVSSQNTASTTSTTTTTPKNAATTKKSSEDNDKTPLVRNTAADTQKNLSKQIEVLDKKGKALFKNGEFMAAADVFTEAINMLEGSQSFDKNSSGNTSSGLGKQYLTFLNNRSAMYEKSKMFELSAADSERVLELDASHGKARTRLLRLYEILERWSDALVQICATQLLVMQQHRHSMMHSLQAPPPLPIPQAKMEEMLQHVLDTEVPKYQELIDKKQNNKLLPSTYAIFQFLKSYSDYNDWMKVAEQDTPLPESTPENNDAEKITHLFKRGRLHAHDRNYRKATKDIEEAAEMFESVAYSETKDELDDELQKQLLEWLGMVKHWQHDFDTSLECYNKRQELSEDARVMVKMAGVYMDNSDQEKALELLQNALQTDAQCIDALFHRANLYMLQQKPEEAKADLEQCIKICPSHVMARLRLASILAAMGDNDGATKEVDSAEESEPYNSEVHSYRGELCFTRNDMTEALQSFEKAIDLEPANPTPYVNASLAILNTPPPSGGPPDVAKAISMLEQAIEVDSQFAGAYIQLGQLKLGTATNLMEAEKVIGLYDQALENCRSPEELKELCSMRILAVSQVEAASLLKMESFSLG